MRRRLVPFYKMYHECYNFYGGLTVLLYKDDIGKVVQESGAKTILDYGCGKAQAYSVHRMHKSWPPVTMTFYDPAVTEFLKEPAGPFDGVICCDVLEHIPPNELPEVLEQLANYAKMWLFIAVCCRKADHKLPDGQNEHVIIEPPEWWQETLTQAFHGRVPFQLRFTP